jgi:hypothetical protein
VVAASYPGFRSADAQKPAGRARAHLAFVPTGGLDPVTVNALQYARALAPEVVAIHVVTESEERPRKDVEAFPERFNDWASQFEGERPHLVVIESPYRSVVPALVSYILVWRAAHPDPACTVVVPELVDERLHRLWLHNHRAFWLKTALLQHQGIGVVDVTLHVGREAEKRG